MNNFIKKVIIFAKSKGLASLFFEARKNLNQIFRENDRSLNPIDPRLETILLVSHEASRTGSPILSYNLARELVGRFNVVVVLLGSGPLIPNFKKLGVLSVHILNKRALPAFIIQRKIHYLCKKFHFKFAIINSIESRTVLEELSRQGIPTVTLIHEFATYTRPEDAFRRALFWSGEVVFSANIVRDNAISKYPDLALRHCHVLPQGRCLLPKEHIDADIIEAEFEHVRILIRPKNLNPATTIVLGAGFVQIRKGIDLFVECATRVFHSPGGENFRFVWIGKGYDPEGDISYSAYIKDQVERAGLKDHIIFIDETYAIEAAYEEADLFLLSSRLDPLPNVAIEAMSYGVPVLCFSKSTGIADFLIECGLEDACVAQYIDTTEMAQKIIALVGSKSLYEAVSQQCRKASIEFFDMKKYVGQLEEIGNKAATQGLQEFLDAQTILNSGLFMEDFGGFPYEAGGAISERIHSYVRSWASGVGRRKPFPGFHPGVYLERHGVVTPKSDPFADYIRSGCPEGAWSNPVISSKTAIDYGNLPDSKKVALHIHVFYPDLLPVILEALAFNRIEPDIFLSVRDEATLNYAKKTLKNYMGRLLEIKIVPNRGRDIGSFLTQFGKTIIEQYEFCGHIHTKKSIDIKDTDMGKAWFKFLVSNLLGIQEAAMADAILSKLNSDASLGLVFPDDPNIVGWEKNEKFATCLAKKIGITQLPIEFTFPIGAMFWAKTSALKGLVDLNLDWTDYPLEPLPYDGSTLHALERLVGISNGNFQVATTHVNGITR